MARGTGITISSGVLQVPDNPEIHYIEGDGIGVDITPVMMRVVDSAVEVAYGGAKRIHWNEVLAGQKAFDATGEWRKLITIVHFLSDVFWVFIFQECPNFIAKF